MGLSRITLLAQQKWGAITFVFARHTLRSAHGTFLLVANLGPSLVTAFSSSAILLDKAFPISTVALTDAANAAIATTPEPRTPQRVADLPLR